MCMFVDKIGDTISPQHPLITKTLTARVCWGNRYVAALQHAARHSNTEMVTFEPPAAILRGRTAPTSYMARTVLKLNR